MKATLRDYQRPLHASAVAALTEGTRGQAIMACGTGKTITGLRIVESLPSDTVLLLFPNLALLAQTARSWAQHSMTSWTAIAVCSEKDIKGVDRDRTTAAEVSASTGMTSTTDPELVRAFLTRPGRKVVFSTYQSSAVITAAVPDGFAFDVLLADEAHRTSGAGLSPSFGACLDDALIPARRRLFMTATQRVASDRGKQALTRSMDDVALYGEVVAEYGFKEAIEAGVLADYQLAVVYVDQSEVDAIEGETSAKRTHMLTTAIATVKASRKHDLHRMIAYHATVAESREFADTLTQVAGVLSPDRPLYSAHVDGSTKSARREAVLERLRDTPDGSWSVVTNARVLTEGIDVPELDGVVFGAPRKSEVDVAQIVGRALRTGKRTAPSVILIPVLIPDGLDAEEAISGSAFDVPFQIMRSMRRVDARITAEFTAAHMETREDEPQVWTKDEEGTSSMTVGPIRVIAGEVAGEDAEPTAPSTPRIEVWLPESISMENLAGVSYDERIRELSRSITTRMIDTVTDSWDKRAAETVEFMREHGRGPSSTAADAEEKRLGKWLSYQRAAARRSAVSFTPARRAYLDEAMPGWLSDVIPWEHVADRLAAFIILRLRQPLAESTDPEERKLGRWLSNQRRADRHDLPWLTPARRAYLDGRVPGWRSTRNRAVSWKHTAGSLWNFVKKTGRHPSVESTDPEERKLGQWLNNQRTDARKSLPRFTPARRAYLDEYIPGWDTPRKPGPRKASS